MMNKNTLKEKLETLFYEKNTKAYARLVSTRPEIYNEVLKIQINVKTTSITETLWCILHETLPPRCVCGGSNRLFNTFNLGYRNFCGSKCPAKNTAHGLKISKVWEDTDKLSQMIKKRNSTCLEKYGHTNPLSAQLIKDKVQKTNLERYGVAHPLQSEEIQNKIKNKILSKYGVEYPFQSTIIQQKSSDTFSENHPNLTDKMQLARLSFIEKHGSNPFAIPEIKDKIYKNRKEKYGYVHALQAHLPPDIVDILENKEKFINYVQTLTIAEAGEKLGVAPTTVARRAISYDCRDIFAISSRSKWEFKLKNFLLSINLIEGVDFIQGDRSILKGKELDFYFPKIKAAIEVGSVFYHSEVSAGRNYNYHHDKWKRCKQHNIDLFQYWDFEMDKSWNIIESKIKYLFNKISNTVGARKIKTFSTVPIKEEKEFLYKNHIQGFSGDRRKTFGAYYNGELVGIMALAIRKSNVEIVRYATTIDTNYPGLFSKLLKFSLNELDMNTAEVLSYSDNRHSSGNVYNISGFTLLRESAPNYYYTKNYHSIENKKKFTKQKIEIKFNVSIENKTEWQLMQELGYDRIWDAGKKLWKLPILTN